MQKSLEDIEWDKAFQLSERRKMIEAKKVELATHGRFKTDTNRNLMVLDEALLSNSNEIKELPPYLQVIANS